MHEQIKYLTIKVITNKKKLYIATLEEIITYLDGL